MRPHFQLAYIIVTEDLIVRNVYIGDRLAFNSSFLSIFLSSVSDNKHVHIYCIHVSKKTQISPISKKQYLHLLGKRVINVRCYATKWSDMLM